MSGTRQVRIVGSEDAWEVLCETETTMVLVNPAARERRQIAELESRLANIRTQLEQHREARADVGNGITGP